MLLTKVFDKVEVIIRKPPVRRPPSLPLSLARTSKRTPTILECGEAVAFRFGHQQSLLFSASRVSRTSSPSPAPRSARAQPCPRRRPGVASDARGSAAAAAFRPFRRQRRWATVQSRWLTKRCAALHSIAPCLVSPVLHAAAVVASERVGTDPPPPPQRPTPLHLRRTKASTSSWQQSMRRRRSSRQPRMRRWRG